MKLRPDLAVALIAATIAGGGTALHAQASDTLDPAVIIGAPYSVGATRYVPEDAPNYDDSGYAGLDASAAGVSAAHHTLPIPSYVEVTALASGRTILVRVERRGPLDANRLIDLSPAALAQLEVADKAPVQVRVRRTYPQAYERSLLRTGQQAAPRLDAPEPLLKVLRDRLAKSPPPAAVKPVSDQTIKPVALPPSVAAVTAPKVIVPAVTVSDVKAATPATPKIAEAPKTPDAPKVANAPKAKPAELAKPKPVATSSPPAPKLMVQIGAFSTEARAKAAAKPLNAKVIPAGKFWRVRTGPYLNRGEADAGLAKARAAGYADARVVTPD